ncbi:MAG: PQQ-binding-like beta-propeller repeat protein [Alphaproteobacteria bacterium]|nr:PQQ-binding-like beta-propeller repeat protein [Alphaproteobacteria bacterium]
MKKIITLLLCCTLLVACSDDKRYAPKEGRIPVFVAKVPVLAQGSVKVDEAQKTSEWSAPFFDKQNKQPNLVVDSNSKTWRKKIGKATDPNRLLPTPLVVGDYIYTLDGAYELTKLKFADGEIVWQNKIAENKTGLSLTYIDHKIFALSTDGLLTAFDEDGNQLWQKDFAVTTRAPLQADKNTLYLITAHDQFIVLSTKTGAEIWRYQTTKPQTLLTNMAPVAKSGNTIVVPFATGEVMGFDADSGLLLWIQMMVGNRPQDLTEVPQIVAAPIIEGGTVYLTGHANFSGAYALKTGETKWSVNFGSIVTPVLSGNTLFMLTSQNELVALDKKTGKAFWLKTYKSEDHTWQSLSLINGELVLSDGENMVYINPETGSQVHAEKYDTNALPIAKDGHLILMDKKTNLTVY